MPNYDDYCYMFQNYTSLKKDKILNFLDDISNTPLTCVCFLSETEVLCCNSLSQMKLWDLRNNKSDVTANINNFAQVILLIH